MKEKLLYVNGVYCNRVFINDKLLPDAFFLYTKDGNNKKHLSIKVNPKVEVYINNEEPTEKYYLPTQVPIESVHPIKVPYYPKEKFKEIHKELVKYGFEDENLDLDSLSVSQLKNYYYKSLYVHDADIDIEDYMFDKVKSKYSNDMIPISIGFFDIETNNDKLDKMYNETEPLAPIILNTILIDDIMYVFLFNDPGIDDPRKEKFWNDENYREAIKQQALKDENEKGAEIKDIKFFLFNDEIAMIEAFFKLLHKLKPEIVAAWNIKFDIQYLLNRYSYLNGYEILEDIEQNNYAVRNKRYFFTKEARKLVCDYDWIEQVLNDTQVALAKSIKSNKLTSKQKKEKEKELESLLALTPEDLCKVYYYEDRENQDFADKGDFFKANCYTNFVDQMLIYAAHRKSAKKASYTLDAIAEEELGDTKKTFSSDVTKKNVFSKMYIESILYNIHDVALISRIEKKTLDIMQVWTIAQDSACRLDKVFKKTVMLRAVARRFYRNQGYILSNNHNASYIGDKTKEEKISGGFVGDPNLIDAKGYYNELLGKNLKYVFENVIDLDFSSQYPSTISAWLIANETLFGKIIMMENREVDKNYNDEDEEIFENEEEKENKKEIVLTDTAKELVDVYISEDIISTCSKYLLFPNLSEIIELIEKNKEMK
jgi:DNA polymerase elongation subunit (family B)